MSNTAPNGVTLADYDPLALGGIVMAAVLEADVDAGNVTLPVNIGTVIAGSLLRVSGNIDHGNHNYAANSHGQALSGSWMCLGYLERVNNWNNANMNYSTIWLRVA